MSIRTFLLQVIVLELSPYSIGTSSALTRPNTDLIQLQRIFADNFVDDYILD